MLRWGLTVVAKRVLYISRSVGQNGDVKGVGPFECWVYKKGESLSVDGGRRGLLKTREGCPDGDHWITKITTKCL